MRQQLEEHRASATCSVCHQRMDVLGFGLENYDRMFVQRLREAHGNVLPLITAVRVGTRNDLVRQMAATTQDYVTRHITYLENTGLVDYSALPDTPSPGLLSGSANWTDLLVPGLVLVACILVAVGLGATLRGRGNTRKASAAVAPAVSSRAPRIATARSLIALPQGSSPPPRQVPDDDIPTGTFPAVETGTGSYASVRNGTGRFAATGPSATPTPATDTGGFPFPRTPGRGIPHSDGVTATGPRHAVRR